MAFDAGFSCFSFFGLGTLRGASVAAILFVYDVDIETMREEYTPDQNQWKINLRFIFSCWRRKIDPAINLSFVRPLGPDFAPALPRAMDVFLDFDFSFFYHLGSCRTCKKLTSHRCRSGIADALQQKPGLFLPVPKVEKLTTSILLLTELRSKKNWQLIAASQLITENWSFDTKTEPKTFRGETPYHRKLLEGT